VSDWSLSIQPISEDDQGEYICQVNTEPQIITKIVLQVLLPPKIIEEKSTIMPEPVLVGETLRLYCHAEGMPAPQVSWYFRHLSNAPQSAQKRNHHTRMRHLRQSVSDQIFQEGSTLVIKNISTHYSGIFECIANNSVPPAASRKIKVNVECKR
jgi:neurotrimin